MEKDNHVYLLSTEAERGGRSLPLQANIGYSSSPHVHPICHGRPTTSYGKDDDDVKAATVIDLDSQTQTNNNNNIRGGGGGGAMVDYMLNNASIISSSSSHQHVQSPRQLPKTINNNNNMSTVVERTLSFADVMQYAELGPKLILNHNHPLPHIQQQQQLHDLQVSSDNHLNSRSDNGDNTSGIDPVSFLKFPVLSDQLIMSSDCDDTTTNNNAIQPQNNHNGNGNTATTTTATLQEDMAGRSFDYDDHQHHDQSVAEYIYGHTAILNKANHHHYTNPVQLEFLGNATVNTSDENFIDDITGGKGMMEGGEQGGAAAAPDGKSSSSKRKRPRTIKTSEEVESQRMTHIAVERNRRKQMNEHLRVLRSLMPNSYVQRGDQASIIGGAIEFVRELEQLLQCLESQKRRRLYGDQQGRPLGESSSTLALVPQQSVGFPSPQQLPTNLGCGVVETGATSTQQENHNNSNNNNVQLRLMGGDHELDPCNNDCTTVTEGGGLLIHEETVENKSCIADVEVKMLGFDALIKILSRRRPGQLIKTIAALEEQQLTILHTNITTIERTVLYSFNVKVGSETRFTAEDIANSVQQIFTFIHANSNLNG